MEKVFEYSRFGFTFTVYPNRIEVSEGPWKSIAKKTTLLIRNIASVEIKGMSRKLFIRMNDNTTHEYIIGLEVENAVSAINGLM